MAFPGLKFPKLEVEGTGRDFDLAVGHRLTEKVISLQIAVDGFLGQVEFLVSRKLGLEFGQDILFHRDALVGLLFTENRPNVVITHVDFVGELEIDGGHAIVRRLLSPLEDLVTLRVLYFEDEVFSRRRLQIKSL